MLFVYFKAPFGAFKPFQSIELHSTADFITYSAAYGLLLGLAGVDCHANYQRRRDFIGVQIAIGQIGNPLRGRVLQQLHKMPQTNPSPEVLDRAKGNKPKVDIFRRDYLRSLEGFIGLQNSEELEALVRRGINEPSTLSYWGLPFMGDNNFFVETLETKDRPSRCRWFYPFKEHNLGEGERLYYFSVWTDYEPNPTSSSRLFALSDVKDSLEKDDEAWISIGPG